MEYMVSVQEIHLHTRQTSTRNGQMPTRRARTRMDDQRKDHIDPKVSSKKPPLTIRDQKPASGDVKNINSANNGRDLLLTGG